MTAGFQGKRQAEEQMENPSRLYLFQETSKGQRTRAGSPGPSIQAADSFSCESGHREGLGQAQRRWNYTNPEPLLLARLIIKLIVCIYVNLNVKQEGNGEEICGGSRYALMWPNLRVSINNSPKFGFKLLSMTTCSSWCFMETSGLL